MKQTLVTITCATLAAAALLGLTACASPEEQRAADRGTCQGYGFADGTEAFAKCMMKTATDRQKRNEKMLEANQAAAGMAPSKPVSKTECKTTQTVTSTDASGSTTTDSSTLCVSQ